MIRVVIDTSEATQQEIEEFEKIVPIRTSKYFFTKNNVEVTELTKDDVVIAKTNNTYIKTGLYKAIILGQVPREMADCQEKMKLEEKEDV